MEKNYQPLVSVPVITYNSSKTVVETLDSIYNQTYPNLELVVSDDCSTDNTVEICRKWIDVHKERFVRTELLTVEKNTGVSGNMNRSERACRGEWVKAIAGDDLLLPDCIGGYVGFVKDNPSANYVFSRIEPFGKNKSLVDLYKSGTIFDYDVFRKTTKEQLDAFVLGDSHIPAPTLFYNRVFSEKSGIKYDERMPLIEDEPKWINMLKAGEHLYFLDKVTVKYRVGQINALSSPTHVMSPKQFDSICRFFFYYKFPARYQRDPADAVERMIDLIINNYRIAYESESGMDLHYTKEFLVFRKICWPFRKLKTLLGRA